MLLKDLPKEIKDLAIQRAEEQKEIPTPEDDIMSIIDWQKTTEGYYFWSYINVGDFDVYYKKYGATKSKEERLEKKIDNLEKKINQNSENIGKLSETIKELADDTAKLFNRLNQRIKKLEEFSSTYPIYIGGWDMATPAQEKEFEKMEEEIWRNIKKGINKEEEGTLTGNGKKYYQIGQRFQYETLRVETEPYILALIGDCKAVLISLKTGRPWKHPVEIKLPGVVDEHEAIKIGINDMKKL